MNITELEGAQKGQRAPLAVTLKLGQEVVEHLKRCAKERVSAKLVVSNGQYRLQVGDDITYPCTSIPENLNVDLYSDSKFCGRIAQSLSVIGGSKRAGGSSLVKGAYGASEQRVRSVTPASDISEPNMHNFSRSPQKAYRYPEIEPSASISEPTSSFPGIDSAYEISNPSAYHVSPSDTKVNVLSKFLAHLALGPSTQESLVKSLKLPPIEASSLLKEHARVYNKKDTFILDDKFPRSYDTESSSRPSYVLKDKSYKDLRPMLWPHYSDYERGLITKNINNALTRLGYSESHPIRRKIFQGPSSTATSSTKKSSLGGGMLISKKLAGRRSQTESPKIPENKTLSPQKSTTKSNTNKRKFSSSTSSSDEDEKLSKKSKIESETSPSSINEDTTSDSNNEENDTAKIPVSKGAINSGSANSSSDKKLDYYNSLAIKFKSKYKEYEKFYRQLVSNPKKSDKKDMVRLFELHNSLLEWKRKLWNFDSENKAKHNIMNLTKHKKTPSFTGAEGVASTSVKRETSSVPSPTNSKPITPARRFNKDKEQNAAFSKNKTKISLDY